MRVRFTSLEEHQKELGLPFPLFFVDPAHGGFVETPVVMRKEITGRVDVQVGKLVEDTLVVFPEMVSRASELHNQLMRYISKETGRPFALLSLFCLGSDGYRLWGLPDDSLGDEMSVILEPKEHRGSTLEALLASL